MNQVIENIKNQIKFELIENKDQKIHFSIILEPLLLTLKRGFGTSHSFSNHRNNALFKIEITIVNQNLKFSGFGECGLPPLKSGCYLSDFSHCEAYILNIQQIIKNLDLQKEFENQQYDPFSGLEQKYFSEYRNSNNINNLAQKIMNILLLLADKGASDTAVFRAPKSGLEGAIFSSICEYENKHFQDFANFTKNSRFSYYTAAIQEKFTDIQESAEFGLKYTQNLKLKFNSDLDFCVNIFLKGFYDKNLGQKYTIDANASWDPKICLEFLDLIEKNNLISKVKILEQPFPIEYNPGEDLDLDKQWIDVLQKYNQKGILIYADESIATFNDVEKYSKLVNGVNLKLDKAGGIREALKGVQKAKKYDLNIWIGIMVVSDLGTAMAAQVLIGEGQDGDMDGGLLVVEDKFQGGFNWGKNGEILLQYEKTGFGVNQLAQQNLSK